MTLSIGQFFSAALNSQTTRSNTRQASGSDNSLLDILNAFDSPTDNNSGSSSNDSYSSTSGYNPYAGKYGKATEANDDQILAAQAARDKHDAATKIFASQGFNCWG